MYIIPHFLFVIVDVIQSFAVIFVQQNGYGEAFVRLVFFTRKSASAALDAISIPKPMLSIMVLSTNQIKT